MDLLTDMRHLASALASALAHAHRHGDGHTYLISDFRYGNLTLFAVLAFRSFIGVPLIDLDLIS